MKFACFCYYEPSVLASLSEAETASIAETCKSYDDSLDASGRKVAMAGFTDPETYKTIRPGEDHPTVTDGPFVQTSQPIGVVFFVEAEDIDCAVEIASLHPGAHLGRFFGGGIEVRPCDFFELG